MFAIYKKELRSYFMNAIGYVYVGVFLSAAALLCCYSTLMSNSYSTAGYFTMLIFSFIVLIPLLTMKLFSEEKKAAYRTAPSHIARKYHGNDNGKIFRGAYDVPRNSCRILHKFLPAFRL